LAAGAALPIAHVLYYAGGPCYGPRYYAEALPVYLVLVAGGIFVLRWVLQAGMCAWRLPKPARLAGSSATALVMLMVFACTFGYVPDMLAYYGEGFGMPKKATFEALTRERLGHAIVFYPTGHYRHVSGGGWITDTYGGLFWMNSPTLDDEVIFARDLDRDPSRAFSGRATRRVMAAFPGRAGYRFIEGDWHLEAIPTDDSEE
jgi:hypothetical protein